MLKLGAKPEQTREMVLDDILRGRIKLLIFMTLNYLKGRTIGDRQGKIITDNALYVEKECKVVADFVQRMRTHYGACVDENLCHHLRLLVVMIKAAASGYPMSKSRRSIMSETVQIICKTIARGDRMDFCILNVA